LKELILTYQKEKSGIIFHQILERVDKMLIELVKKFSKIYYFTEPTPQLLQDMYQTAIIGLEKALVSFDPKGKETFIPGHIYHQVRNEMFKMYGIKNVDATKYLHEHLNCMENSEIDLELIREDIRNIINNLIDSKRITQDEYELLQHKYIEEMSISEMLRIFGDKKWGSRATIVGKIERVTGILKREFEGNGFGTD